VKWSRLPVFTSLHGYRRGWARGDLVAGLTMDYLKLTGSAAGVMLVGFAEGLGAAKTYAARNGYEGTSGFHRSVDEAVRAAQAGAAREPAREPARDEEPTGRIDG